MSAIHTSDLGYSLPASPERAVFVEMSELKGTINRESFELSPEQLLGQIDSIRLAAEAQEWLSSDPQLTDADREWLNSEVAEGAHAKGILAKHMANKLLLLSTEVLVGTEGQRKSFREDITLPHVIRLARFGLTGAIEETDFREPDPVAAAENKLKLSLAKMLIDPACVETGELSTLIVKAEPLENGSSQDHEDIQLEVEESDDPITKLREINTVWNNILESKTTSGPQESLLVGFIHEARWAEYRLKVGGVSMEFAQRRANQRLAAIGKAAEQLLIKNYKRVLYSLTSRLISSSSGFSADDLVSEGYIGVLDAIESYNPDLNANFRKHALPRAFGSMVDALRAGGGTIRLPRGQVKRANKVAGLRAAGKSDQQIMDELFIGPKQLQTADEMLLLLSTVSLDAPLTSSDDTVGAVLADTIEGHYYTINDGALSEKWKDSAHNKLNDLIEKARLTKSEEFVMAVAFDIEERIPANVYPWYAREMAKGVTVIPSAVAGEQLGVTESRAVQLLDSALNRITACLALTSLYEKHFLTKQQQTALFNYFLPFRFHNRRPAQQKTNNIVKSSLKIITGSQGDAFLAEAIDEAANILCTELRIEDKNEILAVLTNTFNGNGNVRVDSVTDRRRQRGIALTLCKLAGVSDDVVSLRRNRVTARKVTAS